MAKFSGYVLVIILTVTAFVFGTRGCSLLEAWRNETRAAVEKDYIPLNVHLRDLKNKLYKERDDLNADKVKLRSMRREAKEKRDEIARRQSKIESNIAVVLQMINMYKKKKDSYDIHGKSYSRAELKAEIEREHRLIKIDKQIDEDSQEIATELENNINTFESLIAQREDKISNYEIKYDQLKAVCENVKASKRLAELRVDRNRARDDTVESQIDLIEIILNEQGHIQSPVADTDKNPDGMRARIQRGSEEEQVNRIEGDLSFKE